MNFERSRFSLCTWRFTRHLPFPFSTARRRPKRSSTGAVALGYPALALLDHDGVYGAPRFHLAAKAAGIKAIVGAELTIAVGKGTGASWNQGSSRPSYPTSEPPVPSPQSPVPSWRLPVLVASQQGYRNLCRLITRLKLGAPKGEGAIALEDLEGCTAGLVVLVGRPALAAKRFGVGGLVDRLVGLFGRDRVYVELQRHGLRDQEADTQMLVDLAAAFHVPVVATNGVRFVTPDARPLYDVFTCLRHKTTIAHAQCHS